jgi:DMSO/TMAO reductase YedYZ molybdopterin-dependent catalytic subunit
MRNEIIHAMLLCIVIVSLAAPALAATTVVNVTKYAADETTILNETTVTYGWMEANLAVQGDGVTEYFHQGPIFEGDRWDPDETSNLKSKGFVKGTDVKDLCELVGGMSAGDKIKIRDSGGFNRRFGYENVYSPQEEQGPMVLCWCKDGMYPPDYADGMQLVFFANDHRFGNWDMHECMAPEYRYNHSSIYPSSNGLSVKYISDIAIYSNETAETTWNLELVGAVNETMSKAAFEEGVACHGSVSYTDSKGRTWEGIPLWYLMARVDDTNTHGSGSFNETLAGVGYDVTIIAGDGYSKTFNSTYLARNDSYIVACYLNGSELPELTEKGKPLAPLKLVGPYLYGGQKIGNIAKIVLDVETAPTEADLTLIGNETRKYTFDEIRAMPSYTAGGGFKKSTGTVVGPFNYTGVNITYLADLVGGIAPSESMKITASDGYSMIYTYAQVIGEIATYEGTTGPLTMVLAYEEDGDPISGDYGGPLRVAFVGPDSPITDGHFWVKYVSKIEILGGVEEWNLTLMGATVDIADRSTFESCAAASCHGVSWTDDKSREWRGIPLWRLVGVVDDAHNETAKHYFNDTVADMGYNVSVIAGDGYSKKFNSTIVARNNDIILANERDGAVLSGGKWPLKLVGPTLKKSEMVGNVVEIRIPELMLRGDVNHDGELSAADAALALRMAVGSIETYLVADMSGDGRVTSLDALMILQVATPVTDEAALPDHHHIHINVANDAGVKYDIYGNDTYYIRFDKSGLNSFHITTDPSVPEGQVTTTTDQSGTFYITDTGGKGLDDDVILMLAVNGTIPDDFEIHIKSSGYNWTPTSDGGVPASDEINYMDEAVNETFTKSDFSYGPQTWKPAGSENYPVHYGQNVSDCGNAFKLMFIDLNAGVLGTSSGLSGLTDTGAVKVEYSIENLETFAAFNAYAWCNQSNSGQGVSWTNKVSGSGSSGYCIEKD